MPPGGQGQPQWSTSPTFLRSWWRDQLIGACCSAPILAEVALRRTRGKDGRTDPRNAVVVNKNLMWLQIRGCFPGAAFSILPELPWNGVGSRMWWIDSQSCSLSAQLVGPAPKQGRRIIRCDSTVANLILHVENSAAMIINRMVYGCDDGSGKAYPVATASPSCAEIKNGVS